MIWWSRAGLRPGVSRGVGGSYAAWREARTGGALASTTASQGSKIATAMASQRAAPWKSTVRQDEAERPKQHHDDVTALAFADLRRARGRQARDQDGVASPASRRPSSDTSSVWTAERANAHQFAHLWCQN